MDGPDLHLLESAPLPYVLSLPGPAASAAGPRPLLCFLHGHGEGAPTPMEQALTRHGPLAPTSGSLPTTEFIVVAPQLPRRGDDWCRHEACLHDIVRQVLELRHGDPQRLYLSGLGCGADGVLDLALRQPGLWAALWPVDPTRVPLQAPSCPVWLSAGEVSRRQERAFVERLGLQPGPEDGEAGDRVLTDAGEDHACTARHAYADARIYRWLLSKRRPAPAA